MRLNRGAIHVERSALTRWIAKNRLSHAIGRVCRASLSRRGLRYPYTELRRAIDAVQGVEVEQTTLGSPMSLKREDIAPRDPARLDDR